MGLRNWIRRLGLNLAEGRWRDDRVEIYVRSSCRGLCWKVFHIDNDGEIRLWEHVCRHRMDPRRDLHAVAREYLSYDVLVALEKCSALTIYLYDCRLERRPRRGYPPAIKILRRTVRGIPAHYPDTLTLPPSR